MSELSTLIEALNSEALASGTPPSAEVVTEFLRIKLFENPRLECWSLATNLLRFGGELNVAETGSTGAQWGKGFHGLSVFKHGEEWCVVFRAQTGRGDTLEDAFDAAFREEDPEL